MNLQRLQMQIARLRRQLDALEKQVEALQTGGGTHTHPPSGVSPQGSGSGLDADMVDGKHASEFAAAVHTHQPSDVNGVAVVHTDTFQGDLSGSVLNPTVVGVQGISFSNAAPQELAPLSYESEEWRTP